MFKVGESVQTTLPITFKKVIGRVIEANNESVRLCAGETQYYAAVSTVKKVTALIASTHCGSCSVECSFRRRKHVVAKEQEGVLA
jgi:hypothetical protein